MKNEAMQSVPKEVRIYSDEDQVILQLRQSPAANDPLAQAFQVATVLTPPECVTLALTLLQKASPKLIEKSAAHTSEEIPATPIA